MPLVLMILFRHIQDIERNGDQLLHFSLIHCTWFPLPFGVIQTNFDGAKRGLTMTVDFIQGNHIGELLWMAGYPLPTCSITYAELVGPWEKIGCTIPQVHVSYLWIKGDFLIILALFTYDQKKKKKGNRKC